MGTAVYKEPPMLDSLRPLAMQIGYDIDRSQVEIFMTIDKKPGRIGIYVSARSELFEDNLEG